MRKHRIICYSIGALAALLIVAGDFAVAFLSSSHPRASYGLPLLLGMTMTQTTNAFWWPSGSSTENKGQEVQENEIIKVETPLPDEDEKDTTLDAKKQQHDRLTEKVEVKTANEEQINNVGTQLAEKDNSSSEAPKQQQEQVMKEVRLEQNDQPEVEEEEIEEDEEEPVEEEEDEEYQEEEEEEEEEEFFEEVEEEEAEEEEENRIQAWFHNALKGAIELFYVDSETGEKYPAAPYGEHIIKSDHMVAVLTGHGHVFHVYPIGGDNTGEPLQTFEINADHVNEEDGSLTFRIEL